MRKGLEFVPIDLASLFNRGLTDDVASDGRGGWTDQGLRDLRHLPVGRQRFDGVPYDLGTRERGAVLLKNRRVKPGPFPDTVTVPVDDALAEVYLLYAAVGPGEAPAAPASGSSAEIVRVMENHPSPCSMRFHVDVEKRTLRLDTHVYGVGLNADVTSLVEPGKWFIVGRKRLPTPRPHSYNPTVIDKKLLAGCLPQPEPHVAGLAVGRAVCTNGYRSPAASWHFSDGGSRWSSPSLVSQLASARRRLRPRRHFRARVCGLLTYLIQPGRRGSGHAANSDFCCGFPRLHR